MADLTATDYATIYLGLGERPVPIPAGEKGPKIPDWTTKEFGLTDFSETGNIGLRMGRNENGDFRVALDFDYDVADERRYAKSKAVLTLLAETDKLTLSKGRRGYTGHFVLTEPVPNQSYENLKADLLSDGKQTVVAPSAVDGVTRVWEPGIDAWAPPRLDAKQLVRVLELADLLAKYVGTDGVRHQIALGLRAFVRARELDVDLFKRALTAALLGTDSRSIEDHLRTFDQETGTEYNTLPRPLYEDLDKMFRIHNVTVLDAYRMGDTRAELRLVERGPGKVSYSIRISRYDGANYHNLYFERDDLRTLRAILSTLQDKLDLLAKQGQ